MKLEKDIKAAVEIDGQVVISMENSQVFQNIGKEEAFLYIKSTDGKEVKVRFLKNETDRETTN